MIRPGTWDDWSECLRMTLDFNSEFYGIPINEDKLAGWFERHINYGAIFFSQTGYIAGLPIMDPVRDWCVLMETGWYDTGKDGLRLLTALTDYARSISADEVRMTTLNTTPDGVDRLLARKGFVLREKSHSLIL